MSGGSGGAGSALPGTANEIDAGRLYFVDVLAWLESVLCVLAERRRGSGDPVEIEARASTFHTRLRLREAGDAELTGPLLRRRFALTPFEEATALFAAGASLDGHLRELAATCMDDRRKDFASPRLALELFCSTSRERLDSLGAFDPDGHLRASGLLALDGHADLGTSPLDRELCPSGFLVGLLRGKRLLPDELTSVATLVRPTATLDHVAMEPGDRPRLVELAQALARAERPRDAWGGTDGLDHSRSAGLLVSGARGAGLSLVCRALGGQMGRSMISLDCARLAAMSGRDAGGIVELTFREAALGGEWLLLDDADELLAERRETDTSSERELPRRALRACMQTTQVVAIANVASTTTVAADVRDRFLARHELRPFGRAAAEFAWQVNFPGTVELGMDVDFRALSEAHPLSGRQVQNAVRLALRLSDRPEVDQSDLVKAAALQGDRGMSAGVRRTWVSRKRSDLLLPAEVGRAIDELIETERNREQVLEKWQLARKVQKGLGLVCLFDGPPGTGKTMAAEVIACVLGLPLFTVSVANVVSKWVGETEKNLQSIFDEAQKARCLLLFDEADVLFTKRTEVQRSADRYSNMEVGLLLQLVESYRGLVVLTTNIKDSIDPAFARRFTFKLRFPNPDADVRLRIWEALLPRDRLADDVDLASIARRYELSGGAIRNIVLRAAYRAALRPEGRVTATTIAELATEECRASGQLVREDVPPVRRG